MPHCCLLTAVGEVRQRSVRNCVFYQAGRCGWADEDEYEGDVSVVDAQFQMKVAAQLKGGDIIPAEPEEGPQANLKRRI